MASERTLILGIGNILWADEGFGVRVAQALQRRYAFPDQVTIMDGGTQGLGLIPYVQDCDTLIVVDAVDFNLEPGALVELRDGEVPAFLGTKKMSLHQISFQEVLALCELMGRMPSRLCLIGVQPQVLEDYGGSLSEVVRAQLEPAVAKVLAYLAEQGIGARVCEEPVPGDEVMDIARYERERPSPEEACRVGDARFIALRQEI
jgi:hydrogenase maturation protease